jgi:methionyl-tRNA formyltransferase
MNIDMLFVGDPTLGPHGLEIIKKRFPQTKSVIWRKGDKPGRESARGFIRSQKWDVAISFYNDLLFKPECLDAMSLPLNIHPARPELPGVGYDTVPLLDDHEKHGATLHTMNENIDDGRILHVLERPLPSSLTGKELRRRNQKISLELLDRTVDQIAQAKCWREAQDRLATTGNGHGREWSEDYISKKLVNERLEKLKAVDPQHPVFV